MKLASCGRALFLACLVATAARGQAPKIVDVLLTGGSSWPTNSISASVVQNTMTYRFDQGVTGVTAVAPNAYHADGSALTSYRIQTTAFSTNKPLSFTNLLMSAHEETNLYIMATTGMVVNANGTWDGIFSLLGGSVVTDRLQISVNAVYWTNTSAGSLDLNNVTNFLGAVGGNGNSGVGFMRDGSYEITNGAGTASRKVFLMDASNATVALKPGGAGRTISYASNAGDPSGRSVISLTAGKTNVLQVLGGGTFENRYGLHIGESGDGKLIVSGTDTVLRIANSADALFLGLNAAGRGELSVSGLTSAVVRAVVVGSAGYGRLVVDASSVVVSNVLTIGEKSGSANSEVLVTNGGVLRVEATVDAIIGNATGVTGATLRVTGAGSRLDFANSAVLNRAFTIGSGGTAGSQLVIQRGATAYIGGGDSPTGSVMISRGGTASGGPCQLIVDGAGSALTARAVRVSIGSGGNASSGATSTQRFAVVNGGAAAILSDLVIGGSIPTASAGNNSYNGLVEVEGGTLTVASNIIFASRLGAGGGNIFSNHQMSVRAGGVVQAQNITMGEYVTSTITRLTLSGPSTRVEASGLFKLGADGRSNRVDVTDGAELIAPDFILGAGAGTGNVLNISGPVSTAYVVVTNASGNARLQVYRGVVNVNTGGLLKVDSMSVTNADGAFTMANGGTLLLTSTNRSEFGPSGLYVTTGAVLAGVGTIKESTAIDGILAPGNFLGEMDFLGDLTLTPGSAGWFKLTNPIMSDKVVVGGTLNLNGLSWTNFSFLSLGASAGVYTLIDAAATSGALSGVTTGVVAGMAGSLSVDVNNNLILTLNPMVPTFPVLAVSPASLDFGGVQAGATSNLSFTVSNAGTAQLDGTATVSGVSFAITEGTPFSLAAGGSTSLVVQIAPALAQDYSGSVVFESNGGASTNALTGYGYIISGSTNVSVSLSGGQPAFGFGLVSGALYRVQATTNLLDGAGWQDLTVQLTNRSPGSTVLFTETNAAAIRQRAYRVRSP